MLIFFCFLFFEGTDQLNGEWRNTHCRLRGRFHPLTGAISILSQLKALYGKITGTEVHLNSPTMMNTLVNLYHKLNTTLTQGQITAMRNEKKTLLTYQRRKGIIGLKELPREYANGKILLSQWDEERWFVYKT